MEGAIYPWKRQLPDGVVYTNYEEMLKPLPPPPEGFMWAKKRLTAEESKGDGCVTRWILMEKVEVRKDSGDSDDLSLDDDETESKDALPEFIEHIVMPTDTIEGLRLRYKITVTELRKYNDFCGDQFQLCQTLRIPIQRDAHDHVKKFRQRPTREVLKQKFKNATDCDDNEMVKYYLEYCEFNLEAAIQEFKEDKAWEDVHNACTQVVTLSGPSAPPAEAVVVPTQDDDTTTGPPPSYNSFFEKNKSKYRRRRGIFSWMGKDGRQRLLEAEGAYDMANFVGASPVAVAVAAVEQDYVSLPGEEPTDPPPQNFYSSPTAPLLDNY